VNPYSITNQKESLVIYYLLPATFQPVKNPWEAAVF